MEAPAAVSALETSLSRDPAMRSSSGGGQGAGRPCLTTAGRSQSRRARATVDAVGARLAWIARRVTFCRRPGRGGGGGAGGGGGGGSTSLDTSGWVRAVTSTIKIKLMLDNTLVQLMLSLFWSQQCV